MKRMGLNTLFTRIIVPVLFGLVLTLIYFVFSPFYLFVNDTDTHLAFEFTEVNSGVCHSDLDLEPGEWGIARHCDDYQVLYESRGAVWFRHLMEPTNFLFVKVIHFSDASPFFMDVASGKIPPP